MLPEDPPVARLLRLLLRFLAQSQRRHIAGFANAGGWAIAISLLIVVAVGFTILQIARG